MPRFAHPVFFSILSGLVAAGCSSGGTGGNCGDIACPTGCSISSDCQSCLPTSPGAGLGSTCSSDVDCCTGSCVSGTCTAAPDGGLTEGGSSSGGGNSTANGSSSGGTSRAGSSSSGGGSSSGGVSGCLPSATPNPGYDTACNPAGGTSEVCNTSGACVANCNDGSVQCGPGTSCAANGHCLAQGSSSGGSSTGGGSSSGGIPRAAAAHPAADPRAAAADPAAPQRATGPARVVGQQWGRNLRPDRGCKLHDRQREDRVLQPVLPVRLLRLQLRGMAPTLA